MRHPVIVGMPGLIQQDVNSQAIVKSAEACEYKHRNFYMCNAIQAIASFAAGHIQSRRL